jgi:toxin ParE1/3/4
MDSPSAADRQVQAILRAAGPLNSFPKIGKIGRVAGTRELVVPDTPYVVAYAIPGNDLYILAILHGNQRWPTRFGP